MHDNNQLEFLLKFFRNHQINTVFITQETDISTIDYQLRKHIQHEQEYQHLIDFMALHQDPYTIYKLIDQFNCVFYLTTLPLEDSTVPFMIGPYQQVNFSKNILLPFIESYSISPQLLPVLQEIFTRIPVLLDDTSIQTFIQTYLEMLWENKKPIQIQILDYHLRETHSAFLSFSQKDEWDSLFDGKLPELYLQAENALIQAVNQGHTSKAEELLSGLYSFLSMQDRTTMLQSMKNYAITLNALLRKSVELNTNSALQILEIYFRIAQKIEQCTSPDACTTLMREMVRKYSLFVKNHSMRQYSILVQDTIKQIDKDLTADLTLHTIAKQLNVNASYLSTHFKKVTGTAYTDYVNRKRIEHSLLLLNTTTLQIQTIAQYCGISDLNYFTRLFKKYIHLTPSQYRREISEKLGN